MPRRLETPLGGRKSILGHARPVPAPEKAAHNCQICGKADKTYPILVWGNRNSPILGIVEAAASLDEDWGEKTFGYYDRIMVGKRHGHLWDWMAFIRAWHCDFPARKVVLRNCEPMRLDLMRTLPQTKLIVLFGADVVKFLLMRGGKCPDLKINPGVPARAPGIDTPFLLIPEPRMRHVSTGWATAVDLCADRLIQILLEQSQCCVNAAPQPESVVRRPVTPGSTENA